MTFKALSMAGQSGQPYPCPWEARRQLPHASGKNVWKLTSSPATPWWRPIMVSGNSIEITIDYLIKFVHLKMIVKLTLPTIIFRSESQITHYHPLVLGGHFVCSCFNLGADLYQMTRSLGWYCRSTDHSFIFLDVLLVKLPFWPTPASNPAAWHRVDTVRPGLFQRRCCWRSAEAFEADEIVDHSPRCHHLCCCHEGMLHGTGGAMVLRACQGPLEDL